MGFSRLCSFLLTAAALIADGDAFPSQSAGTSYKLRYGSNAGLRYPSHYSRAPRASLNHKRTAIHHNIDFGSIQTIAKHTYQSSGVQKVLELSVITAIGSALQNKLDSKAVSALLLNGLVPAVIVNSLSSIKASSGLGGVLASGVALCFTHITSSHLASRFVLRDNADMSQEDVLRRDALRRTAALQLGTAASALSVFSFVREFVGVEYEGFAALADIPSKCVILFILPSLLTLCGSKEGRQTDLALQSHSDKEIDSSSTQNPIQKLGSLLKDPFNLAITTGLVLALTGTPASQLGFFGNAMKALASAQTPILFLLIGLKLKFNGAALPLCASLLFARHGFVALFTSLFLKLVLPPIQSSALIAGGEVDQSSLMALIANRNSMRLLATLCSQAACSVIAYAQINKIEKSNPKLGYKSDLSFDLVALSFPLAIALNTVTILAGASYVDHLPVVGAVMLAISSSFYLMQKQLIDTM